MTVVLLLVVNLSTAMLYTRDREYTKWSAEKPMKMAAISKFLASESHEQTLARLVNIIDQSGSHKINEAYKYVLDQSKK